MNYNMFSNLVLGLVALMANIAQKRSTFCMHRLLMTIKAEYISENFAAIITLMNIWSFRLRRFFIISQSFSIVLFWCFFKDRSPLKPLSHTEQTRISAVWTAWCLCKSPVVLNDFWQSEFGHLTGRSSVWTNEWR